MTAHSKNILKINIFLLILVLAGILMYHVLTGGNLNMLFDIFNLERKKPLCKRHYSTLYSKARQKMTYFNFYLPLRKEPTERFPVLYLLHGAMDSYKSWEREADEELKRLSALYRLVIITPDGENYGWYLDSTIQKTNRIKSYITKELIPHINTKLLANKVNGRQSIAGISMGGHGALTLAIKDLIEGNNTFQSASSISGILDITLHRESWQISSLLGEYEDDPLLWEAHSAYYLTKKYPELVAKLPIYFTVGEDDEAAVDDNNNYLTILKELAIPYSHQ
ncbi:MAG: alpha/beta hydrolase-fold protein, partial [Spirochaetota bacterium]|nr:alpha/beta hydrolase-fold protein [Spirochaetota bacterium]